MNYITILFLSFISSILSAKVTKPKLCIDCKHFITDNQTGVYGKCSLFPKKEGQLNFLVTGINKDEYLYCSTVRGSTNMCDEEGKMFKKKKIVK